MSPYSLDFQAYIAKHKPTQRGPKPEFQNYAYLEDIRRLQQIHHFDWAKQLLKIGMKLWKFSAKPALLRASQGLQDARLERLWQECCVLFDVSPEPLRVHPQQEAYLAVYGDAQERLFILSLEALSLPSAALRFVFGQALGALANGHVALQTLQGLAEDWTRGLWGLASQGAELILHWSRYAKITQDRAGLLACQDLSAAILVIMKMELKERSEESLLRDLRRYHEGQTPDWGKSSIEKRIQALELFAKSELYLKSKNPLNTDKGLSIEELDAAMPDIFNYFNF